MIIIISLKQITSYVLSKANICIIHSCSNNLFDIMVDCKDLATYPTKKHDMKITNLHHQNSLILFANTEQATTLLTFSGLSTLVLQKQTWEKYPYHLHRRVMIE